MHLQIGQLRSAGDDDGTVVPAEVAAPQQAWDLAVVGRDNGQWGVDMVATSSVWRWKSVVDSLYRKSASDFTKTHVRRLDHSFASNTEADVLGGPPIRGSINRGVGELAAKSCAFYPAKNHLGSGCAVGPALEIQSKYG